VEAFPPDARRRGLDNLLKAPLDGLQHAGVVVDDSQFDALSIKRMQSVAGELDGRGADTGVV
jgi:crossover junction endodeoxyribonuclease RusA